MPLTGVNKKCARCKNTCKQWSQVKVIICPMFEDTSKMGGTLESGVDSKRGKSPKVPLPALETLGKKPSTLNPSKSQVEPLNAKKEVSQ